MMIGRSMRLALAAVLVVAACSATDPAPSFTGVPAPSAPPDVSPAPATPSTASARSACALPPEQLLRVWRGTRPGTSGNVQIVPAEPNYLGAAFSHTGPWEYLQDVPLFWYGPGFIREAGSIDRPAALVDIAPTQAELLGFDFDAPDGRPLTEALEPASARPEPPRLIVTMVWDAAGRNVLDLWQYDWPVLRGMIPYGAWFDRAEVGSSPSNTPPTHASIGTGAWPRRHGIVDLYQPVDGQMVKPQSGGPDQLLVPTLADVYDLANGNEPIVGLVATLGSHTSLIGHGASWEGGDRDIALMRELEDADTAGAETIRWGLTSGLRSSFRMPPYINSLPTIESYLEPLDREDGQLDGAWRGHPFEQLLDGLQSPARVPHQTRIIQEVVRRERFGADEIPDLLFINYKAVDSIGHLYSANGREVSDAVRYLDHDLAELVRFFDHQVGRGRWVLALTADHGHQYDPAVSGAFQIGIRPLAAYLEATFGGTPEAPIVTQVRPTQLRIDEANLAARGATLDDVAAAVLRATQADTADPGVEVYDPDARVFAAAFPTAIMRDLPCLDP